MIEFEDIIDIPEDFTGVCRNIDDNSINYFKNGDLHREDGPALECPNGDKYWFYKDKNFGLNNDFTNKTWKKKVKELKREEELNIFI